MKIENQQDATIKCLLLTSISTCFGHLYAHIQENKESVTALGVLFWFCHCHSNGFFVLLNMGIKMPETC